jgi:ORF6N domain
MRKQYLISIPEETIINKIYVIRGQKVMIDRDLAELYGVGTKVLKQAVKRNIERFPKDFMFEMTDDEFRYNGIASCSVLFYRARSNKIAGYFRPQTSALRPQPSDKILLFRSLNHLLCLNFSFISKSIR